MNALDFKCGYSLANGMTQLHQKSISEFSGLFRA